MESKIKDQRIVYGVCCTWWDSVHKVGSTATHPSHRAADNAQVSLGAGDRKGRLGDFSLPCCPRCGSMLLEVPDEKAWFSGVDGYEQDGHAGYRAFIEWTRGKCFPSASLAAAAYRKETRAQVVL